MAAFEGLTLEVPLGSKRPKSLLKLLPYSQLYLMKAYTIGV